MTNLPTLPTTTALLTGQRILVAEAAGRDPRTGAPIVREYVGSVTRVIDTTVVLAEVTIALVNAHTGDELPVEVTRAVRDLTFDLATVAEWYPLPA